MVLKSKLITTRVKLDLHANYNTILTYFNVKYKVM